MNIRVALMLMVLTAGVAACDSAPSRYSEMPTRFDAATDPYWENPKWDKTLLDTVQASVHNPADPADMSTPVLHAVVKFTYLAGTVEYPEVIQSTGDTEKDQLLLHQLASFQPPVAAGIDADKPHEFVLDLDMPTPYGAFQYKILDAIEYAKVYPKEAIIGGYQGLAIVSFDYLDGKASNIKIAKSSKNHYLDEASIRAVSMASLPPPPPVYAGKTWHLQQVFCYSLNGQGNCPARREVVQVHGTLVRRGL